MRYRLPQGRIAEGPSAAEARSQLCGMAAMLTVTSAFLPDEVLRDLVRRMGGPGAYVRGVLSLGFAGSRLDLRDSLVDGARDVLQRLARSGPPSS